MVDEIDYFVPCSQTFEFFWWRILQYLYMWCSTSNAIPNSSTTIKGVSIHQVIFLWVNSLIIVNEDSWIAPTFCTSAGSCPDSYHDLHHHHHHHHPNLQYVVKMRTCILLIGALGSTIGNAVNPKRLLGNQIRWGRPSIADGIVSS